MSKLDEVFWEKANILIDFADEASGYVIERASLDWTDTPSENAPLNKLDEFLREAASVIGTLELIRDEYITEQGVTDTFISLVNGWWDELCSLYSYEGSQTFDGDLETFLEFLNVKSYEDMGLSTLSLYITNFNLRDEN